MCHDGSTSSLTLATGLGSAFRKRTPSAHLLFYYDFAPFPGGGGRWVSGAGSLGGSKSSVPSKDFSGGHGAAGDTFI